MIECYLIPMLRFLGRGAMTRQIMGGDTRIEIILPRVPCLEKERMRGFQLALALGLHTGYTEFYDGIIRVHRHSFTVGVGG